MGNDYMDKTFLDIVTAHCDGNVDEVKQQMLAEFLKNDPELRRQFVMHLQIHAALKLGGPKFFDEASPEIGQSTFPQNDTPFCMGPCEDPLLDLGSLDPLDGLAQCEKSNKSEKDDEINSPVFSFFTFLSQPVPLAAIMLCVLLLPMAMMVWSISRGKPEAAPTCVASGQVVKALACTWDESKSVGLRPGDLLVNHREYRLTEGIIQLELASGVKTIIQGPAVFRTKSSMLLELKQGRLSAEVPPEGKNFMVTMPGLEVIDRGTEFGVSVDKSAEVELHVFKGRIDVQADHWKQDGKQAKPMELHEGQATLVDRLTGQVEAIPTDESKFVRKFETESGLNLELVNPSFEEPQVANHPSRLKEFGNLRSVNGLTGWTPIKSSNKAGSYPVYLQQAPYLSDPSGEFAKVQKCIQDAINGKQMLGMRLGGVNEAWVFQSIGTIRMGDVGKTLQVSTDVVARKSTNANATAYGSTATAVLAFTCNTTEKSKGKVLGFPGIASGVPLDAPSQHITAELTIKPHMIGQNLAIRLLLHDPDPQPGQLKNDYDAVNQYYFDMVHLKLRHQDHSQEKAKPF